MKPVRAIIVLLSALAALGCESPTAPRIASGSYLLQSYAGHALPALIQQEGDLSVYLLSDELHLALDGSGTRNRRVRYVVGGSTPSDDTFTFASDLVVTRDGGSLRVSELIVCLASHVAETCGDLQNAPATVSGATLTIGPRRYRRSGIGL